MDLTKALFRKRHPPVGARPGTLVLDERAAKPRIRVITYGPDHLDERDVEDPSLLQEDGEGRVTWVDVQGLGDEAVLRKIAEVYKVHPLALEDLVNVPQRPKVEQYEHHLLLIVRMMRLAGDSALDQEQLSILVGQRYILTIQERYGDVFDPVRARIRQGGPVFRSSGPDYLAYALIDAVIDGYFPVLETFGERLAKLEDEILDEAQPKAVAYIHHAKHELLAMRRAVWPLREVIGSLMRDELPFVSEKINVHLRDCYDHCVQIIDVIESYRELAGGLMDAHLSSVANRQNEVMKTLTIMASIFIPLSFLAGLYGMNFDNMPELHFAWAYPALLLVMLAVGAGMVVYFARKGWLGGSPRGHDSKDGDPPRGRHA
jgi:magnesium transporter